VTSAAGALGPSFEQSIKDEARRLGFLLAGVTTPEPPQHASVFETWLSQGRHGSMNYLATDRSRRCRADPSQVMPECRSIIVLAAPYSKPGSVQSAITPGHDGPVRGRVASYAWGRDYHKELLKRLRAIVAFIAQHFGRPVSAHCYTDTGPILERDLAQRAGLGWIGKNTCLINPRLGTYLLLAEILLDADLVPDSTVHTDHCGTCTRCMDACPTACILPGRTIDASRCISYLTIELKGAIPIELRPKMTNWIFGCDLCQMVCPWNRFAPLSGDEAFGSHEGSPNLPLLRQMELTLEEFGQQFKGTPIARASHVGYLRNVIVAAGNTAGSEAIRPLHTFAKQDSLLLKEHAHWAIQQIRQRVGFDE
jgi:epoxyqueuosine reductase